MLQAVGAWVGKQNHGTLGWFDALAASAIPKEWSPEKADRLRRDAFAFLSLPDGSLLALVNPGAKAPPAVALLGSEGEVRTVANSLEEFLTLWSRGETEIHELDDEEGAAGRAALASWLKKQKVKVPKAKDFDTQVRADRDDEEARPEDAKTGVAPRKARGRPRGHRLRDRSARQEGAAIDSREQRCGERRGGEARR